MFGEWRETSIGISYCFEMEYCSPKHWFWEPYVQSGVKYCSLELSKDLEEGNKDISNFQFVANALASERLSIKKAIRRA